MLVVVLGLGLIALVVDRALLLGPADTVRSAAGALTNATSTISTPTADPVAAPEVDTGPSVPAAARPLNVVLARHFEATAAARGIDLQQVPDAFEPGEIWQDEAPAPSDVPRHMPPSEFVRRHALQAIMAAGGRDCAIVSRQLLYAGDELDGWRLTSIGERTVIFRAWDDVLMLELDPDSSGDARRP